MSISLQPTVRPPTLATRARRVAAIGAAGALLLSIGAWLGATVLAPERPAEEEVTMACCEMGPAAPAPALAIVDVSLGSANSLVELIDLRPGERIVAIDDLPGSADDLVAAWRRALAGQYLDLDVRDVEGGTRRVLVVLHP